MLDKTKEREIVTVMPWFDWFDKYKQLNSLLKLTDPCKTQQPLIAGICYLKKDIDEILFCIEMGKIKSEKQKMSRFLKGS